MSATFSPADADRITRSAAAEREDLLQQIDELQARLREAEDTLAAIRRGDVDALVVGDDIYTLDSANATANLLRKDVLAQMQDAVIAIDATEHVIFMNQAAERQYGKTASEVLGYPLAQLYRESWLSADDRAAAQQALQTSGAYRTRSVHLRNDATSIHVESTVSQLRDAAGQVIGFLAVIRDTTDRVIAEQAIRTANLALAQREQQFSTLVENSPDIFARLDRNLRHVYVSPIAERYTGLPPSAHIGRTNLEVGLPRDVCITWDTAIRRVFESREVGRVKFRFMTPAREERTFDCRLVPEFGSDGSVESVLSIASDVTEQELIDAALRESRARLEDADRRKDEFLATLAHELRNPLAPIRNALQIMRLSHEPGIHENARSIIERQLMQLIHLVDDLLDVSRISQGKVELRRERADLSAIVQAALETSRPLIDAGHHELTVRLPSPGALMVYADVTRVTQIIANLLNNAAKYTPERGRIEVSAERSGNEALICVKDSGVGIAPERLPQVFDMFAQIDRTLERAQGGLGIGLALVRKLVEMHGGTVDAQSEGVGRGSVFCVRLPLAYIDTNLSDHTPSQELLPGMAKNCRVLVVDDNVDNADSLSQCLRMLGYQTCAAHDGLEAVEAAENYRPHIALLDIGLPRLSGYEAASRIRRQPGGDKVLLIALSGWGQDEDRRRSKEAGFDHHFVKPVDIEALAALLRTASD